MASSKQTQTPVASFEVFYSQVLNPQGELVAPLPYFACDTDELIALYKNMVLTRAFDTKAIALQRTGKMGTYASSLGQEAVAAAIGHAMKAEDVLLPVYREYGAMFQRGVAMHELFLYWGGDERGMCYANQAQDFPIAVPIASQVPHAVGIAYAMKLRKEERVAVVVIGDGATSKGDFYEGINLAGAWNLPVVFITINNYWAISLPREAQTAAETICQKSIAAGIPGEQVDGNDAIGARNRISKAIEKARQGGGPSVIEPITYRMFDHTTADDASRYRDPDEVEKHKQLDPIMRMRKYLESINLWNEQDEQQLNDECSAKVDSEVQIYLDTPPQPPESMFDHLYAELPKAYKAQRDELLNKGGSNDG